MPVVPKLDAPRVTPSAARLPFERGASSNLAFGGGEARALEVRSRIASNEASARSAEASARQRDANTAFRAASVFERVFRQEQQRQSDLEVLRAKDAIGQFERGVSQDVMARRGANAEGATVETEERLKELEKQVLAEASPGTQGVLQELLINTRRDVLGRVSRHEQKEREAILKVLHESNVAHAVDRFAEAGVEADGTVTPAHLAQMERDVKMHTYAQAQADGLPKEVADRVVRERVSAAHRSRVERLIGEGRGVLAKRYMEQNGDAFLESDQTYLEKHVRNASVKQEAQDILDSYGNVGLGEAVRRARGIRDEDLRSEVISKARTQSAINEEVRRRNEDFVRRRAWERVNDPTAELTPTEMSVMSGAQINAWTKMQLRRTNGLSTEADPMVETRFNLLSTEEKAAMSDQDFFEQYGQHLGDKLPQYAKRVADAREARVSPPTAVTGLMTKSKVAEQMVMRVLGEKVGTKPSDLGGAKLEQYWSVLQAANDEVVQWEEQNKRKADASVLPEILARVERTFVRRPTTTIPIVGLTIGSELVSTSEISPEDVPRARIELDKIPARERAEVVTFYNEKVGVGLQDDDIERVTALRRIMATTASDEVYDRALAELRKYARNDAERAAFDAAIKETAP